MALLLDAKELARYTQTVGALGMRRDGKVAANVLAFHARKARASKNGKVQHAAMHTCMKQLRKRVAAGEIAKPISVKAAEHGGPTNFAAWLSPAPAKERLRPIAKCKRIKGGISKWDLHWMEGPQVVCYERAAGRIKAERPRCRGRPFTRRLLRSTELQTAVASAGDHRVLLAPGKAPRFLSVGEEARAMDVPAASSLTGMLMGTACGTPRQAVIALGGAVHVGVGRCIVRELMQRKWLKRGARYGSAYSGIDTFAAAMEAELGAQFKYVFASEHEERLRRALVCAWGGHGLKATHVYDDAEGEAATHAPRVDLYVCTAVCDPHSKHNRQRSEETQMEGMEGVERALRYVENRRPAIVVAENVNEASVVGPLGAMLRRLEGYEWEEGVLDALTTARVPVSRERYFWIGRRV